ncbi:MAG TPA: hypothetical protein VFN79_06875 [Steroidobacteraceae bacterium]|nr:hypothetical protein [Steroidobacteraceae bacterium]
MPSVVMWSGAKGLDGGISAGATYITPDAGLDDAYTREGLINRQILSSAVRNHHAAVMREALAGGGASAYR